VSCWKKNDEELLIAFFKKKRKIKQQTVSPMNTPARGQKLGVHGIQEATTLPCSAFSN
jgi:hypothetical protein